MANKKLKKLLRITTWIISGAGLFVLIAAAMNTRDQQVCKQIDIEVEGAVQTLFIDRNDVVNMLTANGGRKIKGRKVSELPLKELERALEKNVWIENAELFLDRNAALKVRLKENVPVSRVFATNGNSWYIDSTGNRLPLSDKFSARLPVFTGFPTDKKNLGREDSVLLQRIKELSIFLQRNPFWMAQVSEVNITPSRQLEMYPLVGTHVVELGDGLDLDNRFDRLEVFYKQVMKETGPAAWSRLKIQYNNQVIGIRSKKV